MRRKTFFREITEKVGAMRAKIDNLWNNKLSWLDIWDPKPTIARPKMTEAATATVRPTATSAHSEQIPSVRKQLFDQRKGVIRYLGEKRSLYLITGRWKASDPLPIINMHNYRTT